MASGSQLTPAAADAEAWATTVAGGAVVLAPTSEQMTEHVRRSAAGEVSCDTCGKSFANAQHLKVHKRQHEERRPRIAHAESGPRERKAGGKRLRTALQCLCPACGEVLDQLQGLTRHFARKHFEGTLFACSKCALGFRTAVDCNQHQRLCLRGEDEGKVIRCKTCGFCVDSVYKWKNHAAMTKHRDFVLAERAEAPAPLAWASIALVPDPGAPCDSDEEAELVSAEWVGGGKRRRAGEPRRADSHT